MNVQGLIGEVAKRHNVLVDPQDPVFVVVTLNELLLDECLRRVSAAAEQGERRAIVASERQLAIAKQAAGEIVTRTAGYVADQVRVAAMEASSDIERRVSSTVASVNSSAAAAARHRNVAFVFMMASALASALALSGVASCGTTNPRDRNAALVSNAARVSGGPRVDPR